jgi:hypothetical protein
LKWREARGGPRLFNAVVLESAAVTAGDAERLSAAVLAGLLLLSGATVSAALPKGHRWLFILGIVGSAGTAIGLWAVTGYEDFEGPPWFAAILLTVLYGAPWSLGVAVGFLLREAVGAWIDRRTWR